MAEEQYIGTTYQNEAENVPVGEYGLTLYAKWKKKLMTIKFYSKDLTFSAPLEGEQPEEEEQPETGPAVDATMRPDDTDTHGDLTTAQMGVGSEYFNEDVQDDPGVTDSETNLDDEQSTQEVAYEEAQYSQKVQSQSTVKLVKNRFSRPGYEFLCWTETPEPDEEADEPSATYDGQSSITSGDYQYNYIPYNEPPGPLPTASKAGYEFQGWFTLRGVELKSDSCVCQDITVYPRWKETDTGYVSQPEGTGGGMDSQDPESSGSLPLSGFQASSATIPGSRPGLCGNIIYSRFFCSLGNSNAEPSCRLFHRSSTSSSNTTACASYCAKQASQAYSHPGAPGKLFLKIGVFAGADLSGDIPLLPSKSLDEETKKKVLEFIRTTSWKPGKNYNSSGWWNKWNKWSGRTDGKDILGRFDWTNYGCKLSGDPVIQCPGKKFSHWYLCHDGCHAPKDSPMETIPTKHGYVVSQIQGSTLWPNALRQYEFISTEYLQNVSDNGVTTKGFCFRPVFV